jgi:hypothetical protein
MATETAIGTTAPSTLENISSVGGNATATGAPPVLVAGSPLAVARAVMLGAAPISADPWAGISDSDLYEKCFGSDDSFHCIDFEEASDKDGNFWKIIEDKISKILAKKGDNSVWLQVRADDVSIDGVSPEKNVRENVFSLHISNSLELKAAGPFSTNWWRMVSFTGCNLSATFQSKGLELLLHLDLSFSEISLEAFNASGLVSLRYLGLEGCGLNDLVAVEEDAMDSHWLANLLSLEHLNLSDNELEDGESVSALKLLATSGRRKRFASLDLRENELQEELGRKKYLLLINGIFSAPHFNLDILDNKKLDRTGDAPVKGVYEVSDIAAAIGQNDTVMDSNEFRESCSCLEGNACTIPYNCVDWVNREAVAAAVRKGKAWIPV